MTLKLVFLEEFESEFKGKIYHIFRFVDLQSLTILNGTDLKGNFEVNKSYNCVVAYDHNKFKVVSAN